VQSSFRLYVDEVTPDVVEAALNADSLLRWESVRRVDLMCEQLPKCPICLEVDMIVPKITKCGHVFCAPCVMRYFLTLSDYNGKKYQRCPVCNEQVCSEELTSARFEEMKALRENDRVSFILAHRDASSTVVRLSPAAAAGAQGPALREEECGGGPAPAAAGAGDPLQLPTRGERGWHFSRLVRLQPAEAQRLLEDEVEALQSFRMVVTSEGDKELLPSIDASLAIACRRRRERRAAGGGGAGGGGGAKAEAAGEDLMLPAPAVGLPQDGEAEEDVDSGAELGEACAPSSGTPASGPQSRPHVSPSAGPSSPPGHAAASSSSPGLGASSPGAAAGGRPQRISFYQAADGRLVFLEPFFTRLLLHESGGRWDGLPAVLDGLRLGRLQEVTVSEEVRRRHKFLQHLALGTVVSWAEVDLRKHLSQETKDYFAEEFNKRRQQRKKEQIRGRREQRIGQSRAAEEEERYYQALNYTHPTTIQQRPTAEDFAVSLSGVVEEAARESEGDAAGAEGAGAAGEEGREAEDAGPTLADRIKGKVAAKARPLDRSFAFPELGGGSASGAGSAGAAQAGAAGGRGAGAATSAWGRGRGSDRVKKDSAASQDSAGPVATGWDDDEAGAPPGGPADEQPTFGQALEAALRSAEAEQPAGDAAEAEGAAAAGGKKKKGRAGKATTIRLFG